MCHAAAASAAGSSNEDMAVATWLETHEREVEERIEQERQKMAEGQIFKLMSSLPAERRGELLRDLVGYSRVAPRGGC